MRWASRPGLRTGQHGPGHKADEYISIAQTERCMTMLRQLCAWMRAEPAEPLT